MDQNKKIELAYRMLCALRDSSFSGEMQCYRKDVKEDLSLSEEEMGIFDFNTICELLKPCSEPVRLFKGRPVRSQDRPNSPKMDLPFMQCTGNFCVPSWAMRGVVEESSAEQDQKFFHVQQNEPLVVSTEVREETYFPVETLVKDVYTEAVPVDTAPVKDVYTEAVPVETAPVALQETVVESKNKHPAAKAMRKLCRVAGLPVDDFQFDTDKYPKALVLFGNTKPYTKVLESLGGNWNSRHSAWIFSKEKLMKAVTDANQRKLSQKEEDTE